MLLRPLTADDIPELHRLEAECYVASLHESDEAFLRLIELFPGGAFGYVDGDGLCGYAFGIPFKGGIALELRAPLAALPRNPDIFYIHDVAVAQRCRGRGIGRLLAARLLDIARDRGFSRIELVSVQGSGAFWEKFGFRRIGELEYAPGARATRMVWP